MKVIGALKPLAIPLSGGAVVFLIVRILRASDPEGHFWRTAVWLAGTIGAAAIYLIVYRQHQNQPWWVRAGSGLSVIFLAYQAAAAIGPFLITNEPTGSTVAVQSLSAIQRTVGNRHMRVVEQFRVDFDRDGESSLVLMLAADNPRGDDQSGHQSRDEIRIYDPAGQGKFRPAFAFALGGDLHPPVASVYPLGRGLVTDLASSRLQIEVLRERRTNPALLITASDAALMRPVQKAPVMPGPGAKEPIGYATHYIEESAAQVYLTVALDEDGRYVLSGLTPPVSLRVASRLKADVMSGIWLSSYVQITNLFDGHKVEAGLAGGTRLVANPVRSFSGITSPDEPTMLLAVAYPLRGFYDSQNVRFFGLRWTNGRAETHACSMFSESRKSAIVDPESMSIGSSVRSRVVFRLAIEFRGTWQTIGGGGSIAAPRNRLDFAGTTIKDVARHAARYVETCEA